MFGKTKDNMAEDRDSAAAPAPQSQRPVVTGAMAPDSPAANSIISSGTSITGKIVSDGTVNIFGRVEGELRASTVLISGGAYVEGELIAEDLTIGGRVKGTIHANSVRLSSTAIVEGDIFHRSLAIEENARFEGSSRREENVIDAPSRVQVARVQSPGAASDDSRKRNGAPNAEQRPSPAAVQRASLAAD